MPVCYYALLCRPSKDELRDCRDVEGWWRVTLFLVKRVIRGFLGFVGHAIELVSIISGYVAIVLRRAAI